MVLDEPRAESAEAGALPVEASDDVLVSLLAADSDLALRSLFERHGAAVRRYAIAMTRHTSDAEDVQQEVWLALWDARRKLAVRGDTILPWLLVTARNKSLKLLTRRERFFGRNELDLVAADPSDQVELNEKVRRVAAIRSAMTEADRAIFDYCIVEGVSYGAAARAIGISDAAVRNRLHRIRRRVRDDFSEYEEGRNT